MDIIGNKYDLWCRSVDFIVLSFSHLPNDNFSHAMITSRRQIGAIGNDMKFSRPLTIMKSLTWVVGFPGAPTDRISSRYNEGAHGLFPAFMKIEYIVKDFAQADAANSNFWGLFVCMFSVEYQNHLVDIIWPSYSSQLYVLLAFLRRPLFALRHETSYFQICFSNGIRRTAWQPILFVHVITGYYKLVPANTS